MAERLTEYDFDADPPKRLSPYPIDLWMDSGIWRIWQGEDFQGEVGRCAPGCTTTRARRS